MVVNNRKNGFTHIALDINVCHRYRYLVGLLGLVRLFGLVGLPIQILILNNQTHRTHQTLVTKFLNRYSTNPGILVYAPMLSLD
jgi:hypothetical protein